MITNESPGLPVKVTIREDTTCKIFIPDMNIDVYGSNYVDAMSNAMCIVTAVHYYNVEHNLHGKHDTTYDDVMKMCAEDAKSGSFPTYIQLVDEGIL